MKVLPMDEGDPCWFISCDGKLEYAYRGDGCTCFRCAPCSYCLSGRLTCSVCGEQEPEDYYK